MKAVRAILIASVFGCAYSQQNNNLLETARQGGLTELVRWLEEARLNGTLAGPGSLTLLAPSNEAFLNLDLDTVWQMKSNKTLRDSVLKYHVLLGRYMAKDLVPSPVPTLQGEAITVQRESFDPNKFRIVQTNFDASIDFPNVLASNGMMHFIDTVLLPPTLGGEVSLEEVMRSAGQLSTFLSLARDAGLLDAIRTGGPQTVFAPTDEAFKKVDASILRQLRQEPRLLKAVIKSHMLPEVVSAASIVRDSVRTNNLGELLILRSIGNVKLVNTARIVVPDIFARNGALHVIDGLLLPSINALGSQGNVPTSSLQSKLKQMGLSVLADVIGKAGLESLFTADEPITVFAPSNKAFTQLPTAEIEELLSDRTKLQDFIKQHLLQGSVPSAEFKLDSIRNSLAGRPVRLNIYKKPKSASIYTANGIPITVTDEKAVNGVIHVVDTVIPSTDSDALDVLKNDGRFSTFLNGVQASDFVSLLRAEGPVTVFAATDAAFQALPPEEFFSALLDVRQLSSIIANHLTDRRDSLQTLFSPGLCWNSFKVASGNTLRTAIDSSGHVIISSGNGKVAKVIESDLLASNGVVHVVDALM